MILVIKIFFSKIRFYWFREERELFFYICCSFEIITLVKVNVRIIFIWRVLN